MRVIPIPTYLGVQPVLHEELDLLEDLRRQEHHRRRPVSHLGVLGCRVCACDFSRMELMLMIN